MMRYSLGFLTDEEKTLDKRPKDGGDDVDANNAETTTKDDNR